MNFILMSGGIRTCSYIPVNHNGCCHTVSGFVLLLTDYGAVPGLVNHILQSCLSAAQLMQRFGQVQKLKMNSSVLCEFFSKMFSLLLFYNEVMN